MVDNSGDCRVQVAGDDKQSDVSLFVPASPSSQEISEEDSQVCNDTDEAVASQTDSEPLPNSQHSGFSETSDGSATCSTSSSLSSRQHVEKDYSPEGLFSCVQATSIAEAVYVSDVLNISDHIQGQMLSIEEKLNKYARGFSSVSTVKYLRATLDAYVKVDKILADIAHE